MRRNPLLLLWLGAVLALMLPSTAAASGQLFFSSRFAHVIGTVGFDGSDPLPTFINDQQRSPESMVVSGEYLYWVPDWPTLQIARARTDGSEVNPEFLQAPGRLAGDISVSDGRLYWAETQDPEGYGQPYLSSANLDGSDQRDQLLALGRAASGPTLVMDKWVFFVTSKDVLGNMIYSIVRRRLDGKGRQTVIGANRPYVEGLVGKGPYVYWLEEADSNDRLFIARSNLDAASLNSRWRRVPRRGCHVHQLVQGTAISSDFLFIGCSSGRVDRVSLRGRPKIKTISTGARLKGEAMVLAATP